MPPSSRHDSHVPCRRDPSRPGDHGHQEVRISTQPGAARVVVIGAGIVGNSLVYHLARLGWKHIVQIEKGPLPNPGGSTGHASNFIFLTDHSREMNGADRRQRRAVQGDGRLHPERRDRVAPRPKRMEELKRRMASSRSWGIESELLTPAQVKALVPYINAEVILGGFSTPGIGVVDSLRAGTIMRERAQALGALTLAPMTEVTGIDVEDGKVTRVRTDKGDYEADIVAWEYANLFNEEERFADYRDMTRAGRRADRPARADRGQLLAAPPGACTTARSTSGWTSSSTRA